MRRTRVVSVPTLIVVIFGLTEASCARFRIDELEPSIVLEVPVQRDGQPNPEGHPGLLESGRVFYNLPVRPVAADGYYYVGDPARSLVRVYSGSNQPPESIIGLSVSRADLDEGIEIIDVNVGVPGWVAVRDGSDLYIQASNPTEEREEESVLTLYQRRVIVGSNIDPGPSFVLRLNDEYRLVERIGPGGSGDAAAFSGIERMMALPGETLAVLHRAPETEDHVRILSIFDDGQLIETYHSADIKPGTEEEREEYFYEIEDITPSLDASYVLLSVAFRSKATFDLVHRIIYRLDDPDGTLSELYRSDDPADYFVGSRPDGGFLLARGEEDGSRILFKIFSPQGEYLNNRLIVFPGLRASWRETYTTADEQIFSTRLFRGRYEIYEWR